MASGFTRPDSDIVKSADRTDQLAALNLKGAATAPKPGWAGKKWKEFKHGGMIKGAQCRSYPK